MSRRRVARWLLTLQLLVGIALAATPSPPADAASRAAATALYRVRPDPRLCPSPACGGFWASLANRAATRCRDGGTRPACYVASIDLDRLAGASRSRAEAALAAPGTLVAGGFDDFHSVDFPQLASLAAVRVWLPAGGGDTRGQVYRLADTGIRCVRAPCFSLRATLVNRGVATKLSALDFAGSGASQPAVARARALLVQGGVLVAGAFHATAVPGSPTAGRTLDVRQIWLPA